MTRPVPKRRQRVSGGRSVRVTVRVSEDEAARLAVRAEAVGVTVPRLLTESALGDAPMPDRRAVMSELFAIRRQVAGMATNVNQLAASANSGVFVSSEDVAEVLAGWDELGHRIGDALENVR